MPLHYSILQWTPCMNIFHISELCKLLQFLGVCSNVWAIKFLFTPLSRDLLWQNWFFPSIFLQWFKNKTAQIVPCYQLVVIIQRKYTHFLINFIDLWHFFIHPYFYIRYLHSGKEQWLFINVFSIFLYVSLFSLSVPLFP